MTTNNKWQNIAKVIRTYRTKNKLSQDKLSYLLGYKHGQMISNVERGLAGLPNHNIPKVVTILDIPEEIIVSAMVSDYRVGLYQDINEAKKC